MGRNARHRPVDLCHNGPKITQLKSAGRNVRIQKYLNKVLSYTQKPAFRLENLVQSIDITAEDLQE